MILSRIRAARLANPKSITIYFSSASLTATRVSTSARLRGSRAVRAPSPARATASSTARSQSPTGSSRSPATRTTPVGWRCFLDASRFFRRANLEGITCCRHVPLGLGRQALVGSADTAASHGLGRVLLWAGASGQRRVGGDPRRRHRLRTKPRRRPRLRLGLRGKIFD